MRMACSLLSASNRTERNAHRRGLLPPACCAAELLDVWSEVQFWDTRNMTDLACRRLGLGIMVASSGVVTWLLWIALAHIT